MTGPAPAPSPAPWTTSSGGLLETIRLLVRYPGALTRAQLGGQGERFVSVGRLLLVFALAYLGLVFIQTRRPTTPDAEVASLCTSSGGTGLDLQALTGGTGAGAGITVSPGTARVLRVAGRALCDPAPFTRAFAFAIPIAFLVLIPLFAALMQLAFRVEMPGFADNWTYAVESHAALFLLLTALALESFLGSWLLGFLCSVAGLVYLSWNLVAGVRTAYGVSTRAARWKSTVVGVVYAVCLVVVASAIMWGFLAPELG